MGASRRSKDGRREWSIQHRTVRPPHQWGFGVAFLCGDDRNRKGRDAREHAWGPGPRTNSPVSFSLGERRRTPTSLSVLPKKKDLVWSPLQRTPAESFGLEHDRRAGPWSRSLAWVGTRTEEAAGAARTKAKRDLSSSQFIYHSPASILVLHDWRPRWKLGNVVAPWPLRD